MNVVQFAVVPVLVGPLQALLALLPGLLVALGAALLAMLKPRAIWMGLKLLWRQKLAVVAVAGALVAVALLARVIVPSRGSQVGDEEQTTLSWSMFRGGLSRRGSIDGAPGPTSGGLNWNFLGGGPTYYSSPTVVGNRLYITSADKGPFKDRGAVYCLDADTGGLVWRAAPRGFRATFSSPAVSGRFLVCGEGLHFTDDARVVCIDARRDGGIFWTFRTASHVESSPCIHNDRVYIGAGDDGYYCFRLEPDADGQAVVIWHADGQLYPDAETSPAACDDKVVVGLGMGGKAVCCLHADTGDELWRVDTPYPVFGPPTIVENRVFVGMGNGNFIQSAEEVKRIELDKLHEQGATADEIAAAEKQLGPIGQIWCLDLQTGQVAWKFNAGRTVLGAVSAGDERLYFGSRDGHVYCISLDGNEVAKWNAHSPIVTSPALVGDHVYVVTETGRLYSLTKDGFELAWEVTLGFAGPFLSSPTVARGHVYVGSFQDGLMCLGKPEGQEQELVWQGQLGGPGQGGCIDDQPMPEQGRFAWRFPKSGDADNEPRVSVTAPVACLGDRVYVPVHGDLKGVVCLQDDPESRDGPSELWTAESPLGVMISPAATKDSVFFVDGQTDDTERQLRSLDAQTGDTRWQSPIASGASGRFVLWGEGVLVADGPGGVSNIDFEGNVAWQSDVGRVRGVPAVGDSVIAVATDDVPALIALDGPTGRTLWRIPLNSAPVTGPVFDKAITYVGTDKGLAAFSLVDGTEVWRTGGGVPTGPITLRKGRLACGWIPARGAGAGNLPAGQAGNLPDGGDARNAEPNTTELILVSAATGEVERSIPGVLPDVPPLICRDTILVAGGTGLLRSSAGNEPPQLWMRTSWLGAITSPAVMSNSRVYFGTESRGLVCAKQKKRR